MHGRCLEAGDVHLVIQLVEHMFAVSRWCHGAEILLEGGCAGSLVNQVALFVERDVGGDEDGNGKCRSQLFAHVSPYLRQI
jgi:hypothetical protein